MEQSTHLSWHTTNTTQSHKKTALAPDKQKQQTTHNKLQLSLTFTCVTCSFNKVSRFRLRQSCTLHTCTQLVHKLHTKGTRVVYKLRTNSTQVAHNLHKTRKQVDQKLHTKLHTSCTQLVHKLITSCTLFRFISVPSCCTRWLLNRFDTYTYNAQELTYKRRRWNQIFYSSSNFQFWGKILSMIYHAPCFLIKHCCTL